MTRFAEYEKMIEEMDVEKVTDVEVEAFIDEMAADDTITDQEYSTLYGLVLEAYNLPF